MKDKGFTLFEVIISISLILMISSYFLYTKYFSYILKKQQIEQFVSDIRYIKQLGLQGDGKARITMKYIDNSYTIKSSIDDRTVFFKDNVVLKSFTIDEIEFNKDGWTKGNTICIVINNGTSVDEFKIRISSITGRVKLE